MDIEELAKQADKVIALNNKMNEVFSRNLDRGAKAHMKLAIVAGLCDAYNSGRVDGYNARVEEDQERYDAAH